MERLEAPGSRMGDLVRWGGIGVGEILLETGEEEWNEELLKCGRGGR